MELTVLPLEFVAVDSNETANIRIWGLNKSSEPVLLIVNNYPSTCYLQLPDDEKWSLPENRQIILNYIFYHVPTLVNADYSELNKLYYYKNKKDKFLILAFKNLNSLSVLKRLLSNTQHTIQISETESIKVSLYEEDISMIDKFLAYTKLNYSEWFKVPAVTNTEKISTLNNEYIIDFTKIQPLPESETINYVIYPKIMTFKGSIDQKGNFDKLTVVTSDLGIGNYRNVYQFAVNDNTDINSSVTDESKLLDQLYHIIKTYDPDIIIGYELFTKFYSVLNKKQKKFPNLSRLKNSESHISHLHWQSSAYGYVDLYVLQMEGRISLDLYQFIKRTTKLYSYRFDRVLENFKITPSTEYKSNVTQSALNVFDLFYATDMWTELLELSNIVGVSIYDLFTRGEQIRLFSTIYKQAVTSRYVINSEAQPDVEIEGALNFAVESGVYEDTIWLDFAKLYPSLIIANNICYTTMIVNTDDIDTNQINVITGTNHKQVFQTKYIKPDVRVGILPTLLREKIAQRDITKQQILSASTPAMQNRYKKREKILKNTTNAFYGFLGVHEDRAKLSLIMAAVTVTYLGRDLTESINSKLELEYDAKILYNDTDSISFQKPGLLPSELYATAENIINDLNKDFEDPIRLALDKIGRFILLAQKKYAILEYDEKGEPTDNIIKKGLIVGRSDACQFAENVYSEMLDYILLRKSISETFNMILDWIIKLENDQIPLEDLSIVKKINTRYGATSTYWFKDIFR